MPDSQKTSLRMRRMITIGSDTFKWDGKRGRYRIIKAMCQNGLTQNHNNEVNRATR